MEYVDGIEKRVKIENMRNVQLQRKNQTLERRNQTLEQRNQMLEKENLWVDANLDVWDCRWNNKIQTSTACVLLTEFTHVFVVLIWKFFDKRLTQLLCLIDFSTCSNDNQNNWTLPRVFRSLKSTVKTLQMLLATGSNKTAQTSTCVMVLLLSFALLVIPNVDPFGANSSNDGVLPLD